MKQSILLLLCYVTVGLLPDYEKRVTRNMSECLQCRSKCKIFLRDRVCNFVQIDFKKGHALIL